MLCKKFHKKLRNYVAVIRSVKSLIYSILNFKTIHAVHLFVLVNFILLTGEIEYEKFILINKAIIKSLSSS